MSVALWRPLVLSGALLVFVLVGARAGVFLLVGGVVGWNESAGTPDSSGRARDLR